jgi:hypothetical protein
VRDDMVAFLHDLRMLRDAPSTPADSPVQSPVPASDEEAAQARASASQPSGGAEPAGEASAPAESEEVRVD